MQILAAVAGRKSLPYEESTPRYSRLFLWLYIISTKHVPFTRGCGCMCTALLFVMLHKERSYESIPCKSKCYYFVVLLNSQN